MAGLGGLLYGIDVGIIGGALPYLEATSKLTAAELSVIVAAVLLGSVFSTLFAGLLADWMGRKPLMVLSGLTFVVSIPVIALSQGYGPLFFGRLLQGISGGLIGVVVPLYLAECLAASNRGKGTAIFQWLLTLGIVAAALVGIYYSYRVEAVAKAADAAALFGFQGPGLAAHLLGFAAARRAVCAGQPVGDRVAALAFPARSQRLQAHTALLRSRSHEQAALEIEEMAAIAHAARSNAGQEDRGFAAAAQVCDSVSAGLRDSVLQHGHRRQLDDRLQHQHSAAERAVATCSAHWGYVIFTAMNFLMTMVGMTLVDRKGRRFLFILGTSGIIVALIAVGTLFLRTEKVSVDARGVVQQMVGPDQELTLHFDQAEAAELLAAAGDARQRD